MIPVARHIQYLIAQHDCVIIPGWGALIAHIVPARIDARESLFTPPSRMVVFNPTVNHDDAMIASAIVRCEGCSYATARQAVGEYAGALRRQLDTEGSVTVDRVGTFRLSPEKATLFEPDSDGIANAQFFGLPMIDLQSVSHATPQPAAGEIPVSPAVIRVPLGKRIIRVAASVAVLLGLGLTLSTPITSTLSDGVDLAGIGLNSKSPSQENEGAFTPVDDIADGRIFIAIPSAEAGEAAVTKSAQKFTGIPSRPVDGHDYYLIVASLETRAKAERYLRRHEGEGMNMIEGQQRFRIYMDSGTSVEEASRKMKDPDFRAAHPDAWVYRVR
ncbi:MAG: hypothetical protein J6C91_07725 [Muribaculaceae bacterium]|nr:hypothetical protein [Muribaculaceae bacterium]